MLVAAGNHPFAPPVFEPMALQSDPFHFATWSAWTMPATSDPSVPTNTSVPLAVQRAHVCVQRTAAGARRRSPWRATSRLAGR